MIQRNREKRPDQTAPFEAIVTKTSREDKVWKGQNTMLAATTACFTVTVIMGVWLAYYASKHRRPLRFIGPAHIGSGAFGAILMIATIERGDDRLMLNVALAVAIAAFGILAAFFRRRGAMIAPLYMCHILLAIMFYFSIVCFTLFPNFGA